MFVVMEELALRNGKLKCVMVWLSFKWILLVLLKMLLFFLFFFH